MIDYSIVVRSAQPGTIAENVTEYKAYGCAQVSEVVDLNTFTRHIASHGSTYKRSDIQAVLIQAVDCLREMLLQGKKVCLGELGDFYVGLGTIGAETPAEFTAANIYDVHVNWTPGKEFTNLLRDATFHNVPIRREVANLLRAQKGYDTEKKPDSDKGGDME